MMNDIIRSATLSISVLGASTAFAQENTIEQTSEELDFFISQIADCEVNGDGVGQVTLKNGDVIANPDWLYDSFAVAIKDPNGSVGILNPNTGETIQVTDLCVRTDIDPPSHPNENMDTGIYNYDAVCVSSGLFVEIVDVKTDEALKVDSLKSTFHHVNGDETFLGSCEYEINGVKQTALIMATDMFVQLP